MADTIPQTVLNKTRQDKFILVLDTPKVLKQYQSNTARENALLNLDKIQFSVAAINIPQHSIPPVGLPFRGQTMHVTSQTREEYPVSKVQFRIDNNYDNYWFLWKWLYILNNPRESGMDSYFAQFETLRGEPLDNIRNLNDTLKNKKTKPVTYKHIKMINDYNAYQTIITVYGLREYDEKIVQFDFYNAFITSLGNIDFDYRRTEEIDCSFEFSYGQVDIKLIDPA